MDGLLTNAIAPIGNAANIKATPIVGLLLTPVTADGGSTQVEISGLGQLFAAASVFQSQLAVLQPGAENSGPGLNFGDDFGSFVAEAQNFVDAFNQAKGAAAGLQGLSQADQFAQSLDSLAAGSFVNGASGVNTLAQIGIVAGEGGRLRIDLKSLQAQFNADPAAAFSLLAEAVRAFGSLAAGVQTSGTTNADATSPLFNELSQLIAFQAQLNLFGGAAANLTPLGLTSLLALEPSGGANNLGQRIAALSHFALVSSLLG